MSWPQDHPLGRPFGCATGALGVKRVGGAKGGMTKRCTIGAAPHEARRPWPPARVPAAVSAPAACLPVRPFPCPPISLSAHSPLSGAVKDAGHDPDCSLAAHAPRRIDRCRSRKPPHRPIGSQFPPRRPPSRRFRLPAHPWARWAAIVAAQNRPIHALVIIFDDGAIRCGPRRGRTDLIGSSKRTPTRMLVVPPNGSRQAFAHAFSAPNAPRAEARRAWRWAVLALALALATLAALSPVALLPPLVWPDGAPVSDTVIHALGFSALGCLLGLLFRFSFLGTLAGLFCLGLFGIGLEVAQGLSGLGRDSDPQDAVANAIGLGLALCITLCLRGMKRLAAAAARVFFETPIPRPAARP